MGECLILKTGGGTESDECTATRAQVLEGVKAVTSDSDDEAVSGTMANQAAYTTCVSLGYANPTTYVRINPGAYLQKAGTGYPEIMIPGAMLGDAEAGHVLSSKTVTTKNGVKLTGTMANQGAQSANLWAGGSYSIPAGYHDGNGKVWAYDLASQTQATAGASDIISGKTAYVNGVKLTGTMANSQQTVLVSAAQPMKRVFSHSVTFTMPRNGTVYYSFFAQGGSSSGSWAKCRLTKNGADGQAVIVSGSNPYAERWNVAYPASAGQVIELSTETSTSGELRGAYAVAVIVY